MSHTVNPMDRETARALLALVDEQGLPVDVVQTTDEGFVVPDSIGEAYSASLEKKKAPAKKAAAPPEKE